MNYSAVYLLDDNIATNFYNLDVVNETLPDVNVECFTYANAFIKQFIETNLLHNNKVLLLLDINLPDIPGFEVIEHLEEEVEHMNNLHIIMLSSSNLKVDREKATKYPNVFDFIEKPLTSQKLKNAIDKIF